MPLLIALMAAVGSPDAVRCTTKANAIEITLPASADRRIGSMAVVQGRRWVILADDQNHFVPFRTGVRRLTIDASKQRGTLDTEIVRAFPHKGSYRIVFADNLETEPENMMSLDCLVRVR